MSETTFFLDIDRTTFQTDQIYQVFDKLAQLYPELGTAQELFDARTAYYIYTDTNTYYHDMSKMLRNNGLDPEQVYEKLLDTELAKGRFEYLGLSRLVGVLGRYGVVKALTFGADDYQRFKAAMIPSLRGIPVTTTLGDKAALIGPNGWLIDDKPVGLSMDNPTQFVQVLHGATELPEVDWQVCTSLDQVSEYIETIFKQR